MFGVQDFRHFMAFAGPLMRYHVPHVFALLFLLLGHQSWHHIPPFSLSREDVVVPDIEQIWHQQGPRTV